MEFHAETLDLNLDTGTDKYEDVTGMTDLMTTDSSSSVAGTGMDAVTVLRYWTIVIGIVGMSANGLVLSALLSKSLRKHNTNILLINQCSIDLFTSCMLVITSSIKGPKPVYRDPWGTPICLMFGNEMMIWIGLNASIAGLVCITLERYLKIIHPIWHRKYFKSWMLIVAICCSWVDGFSLEIVGVFSSKVMDGRCIPYAFFKNSGYQDAFSFVGFFWSYLLPLVIFIYSYSHILFMLRAKSKTLQGNTANKTAGDQSKPSRSDKSHTNIIKTLVLVAFGFFLCWTPNQIYQVMSNMVGSVTFQQEAYYCSIFCVFLMLCLNPFIYATKHDAVRKRLREILDIKDSKVSPDRETDNNTQTTRATHT